MARAGTSASAGRTSLYDLQRLLESPSASAADTRLLQVAASTLHSSTAPTDLAALKRYKLEMGMYFSDVVSFTLRITRLLYRFYIDKRTVTLKTTDKSSRLTMADLQNVGILNQAIFANKLLVRAFFSVDFKFVLSSLLFTFSCILCQHILSDTETPSRRH